MEALRANKLRAILTMLGVIIGSACIVLVVTIALTGKRYINGQIEAVGSNIVYAGLRQSGPPRKTHPSPTRFRRAIWTPSRPRCRA